MKPAAIFDALTSQQCEELSERFVHAMAGQVGGLHGGTVTAALLTELWQDVERWTTPKAKPKPPVRLVRDSTRSPPL